MQNNTALTTVIKNLQIEDSVVAQSDADQFEVLVEFIDDLIQNDFSCLLRILYRIDISEAKLKQKLNENKEVNVRSAELIANLVIEREEEKIRSRAKYKNK